MVRVSRHDCCQWLGISRNCDFQLCEVRRNVAETHRKIIVLSWKELDLKAYGPERPRGSRLFVWFYITIADTFPCNLHGHWYYCSYISIQFTCFFVLFLLQFHIFCMLICIIVDTFPYNLHVDLYYFCYISMQFTHIFVLFRFNFMSFTCLFVLLLIYFHAIYIHICIILFQFHEFYKLICTIVDICPYNLHAYLYYFCYNFIIFTCLLVLLLIRFHNLYMLICIIFATIS